MVKNSTNTLMNVGFAIQKQDFCVYMNETVKTCYQEIVTSMYQNRHRLTYMHSQCDLSNHTNLLQSRAVRSESCQQQPIYYT